MVKTFLYKTPTVGFDSSSLVLTKKETDTFRCLFLFGAGDEARTRYLHLGKVALYRMSYTRRNKWYYNSFSKNVNTFFPFFPEKLAGQIARPIRLQRNLLNFKLNLLVLRIFLFDDGTGRGQGSGAVAAHIDDSALLCQHGLGQNGLLFQAHHRHTLGVFGGFG